MIEKQVITFYDYHPEWYINICVDDNYTDPIGHLELIDGKWYCCMHRYGYDMPAEWIGSIADKLKQLVSQQTQ